jgi:WW domain-containing oxidoreductase
MFNKRSTAEDVASTLDLSGKTILLTGCNSGLGFETMRVLAHRGAHILALARNEQVAAQACARIQGQATPFGCDHSDLTSVASCAEAIMASGHSIDAAICNAGVLGSPKRIVKHGVELQFLVNHLSHFLLIGKLLDQIKAAERARIVVVSSRAHKDLAPAEGIQFDNLDGARGYKPLAFYGQSKLANILFANELSRRLDGSGVIVNSLHPGDVPHTGIVRNIFPGAKVLATLARPFMRSIRQGAATQCFLAVHPAADGVTGEYFSNCQISPMSEQARDIPLAKTLWECSEGLVRGY